MLKLITLLIQTYKTNYGYFDFMTIFVSQLGLKIAVCINFFIITICLIFRARFWNHEGVFFRMNFSSLGCRCTLSRPPSRRPCDYALHVFPGETVSRLRSHETRLPGYRRVVALIRESGNGDSETFEPSPTPVLLSRLELGGAQLGGRRTSNAMHNGWVVKYAILLDEECKKKEKKKKQSNPFFRKNDISKGWKCDTCKISIIIYLTRGARIFYYCLFEGKWNFEVFPNM